MYDNLEEPCQGVFLHKQGSRGIYEIQEITNGPLVPYLPALKWSPPCRRVVVLPLAIATEMEHSIPLPIGTPHPEYFSIHTQTFHLQGSGKSDEGIFMKLNQD